MNLESCSLRNDKDFKDFQVIEKINKGWSSDRKYYVEDKDGKKLLLRISDISQYEEKLKEFEVIKKLSTIDCTMSKAIDFGICEDNKSVYMLLTWVEGHSLIDVIKNLDEEKQYSLGIEAGKILKSIHSIEDKANKNQNYDKSEKMLRNLKKYENSMNRIDNDEVSIDYVRNNISKLNLLSPTYKHGDYHVGNMILTPDKEVGIIDFNRWEYGDRYEEFQRIQSFDVEASIPFSVGKIHGYFEGNPPIEFWECLAVYVAYTSLYSIVWAEKFGQEEINGMIRRAKETLRDYDNFNVIIPRWYKEA